MIFSQAEQNRYAASRVADAYGEDDRALPLLLGSKSGTFLRDCRSFREACEDTAFFFLKPRATGMLSLGSQGCLAGNTRLPIHNGKKRAVMTLDQIAKNFKEDYRFGVASFDFLTKKARLGIAQIFETGEKELFRIEMRGGGIVESSPDHTFFKLENGQILETRTENLKKGDLLVVWDG